MRDDAYWNPSIETMGWSDVESLQTKKLLPQLQYVHRRSSFYKKKWKSVGFDPGAVRTVADLQDAPFTEKEELREEQIAHPPLGEHAAAELKDVIRIHSSSGTTGRPNYIGVTVHDRNLWTESISRAYYCMGLRSDDVLVHGFALTFFVGGLPVQDAVENIGATFVPIGAGASDRLVTSIQNLGGTALACTPSYAKYLDEFVRQRFDMEPKELGLRRIFLGAEPGGGIPVIRDRIAAEFHAKVNESLGNADLLPVYAANCDQLDGDHFLAPDLMFLELIDPATGELIEWEDGATGELVATHLERECVPLVRFRTRDRVVVKTSPCSCGRTGPRLNCIGRTDDMLIVAGTNVWPSALTDAVATLYPRVTGALEILLLEPGPKVEPPLRVRVEYGSEATNLDGLKQEIEGLLREKLTLISDVELCPPETLPRFEMKAKLIRKLYEEGSFTGDRGRTRE